MSDKTDEKQKDWLFKKGQSGNPQGRPKGKFSIKTRIIQRLEDNPEQVEEMIDYLIKNQPALVWQMIDGKPPQPQPEPEYMAPYIINITKAEEKK